MENKWASLLIFWNTQDGEGWAFRLTDKDDFSDGGMMSEVACYLPVDATNQQLCEAAVSLAYRHGIEIETDDVIADSTVDGGYAKWLAP